MGPSTVLTTPEEDILVKWTTELSDRHFPITKEQLLDSVQRIIIEQKEIIPLQITTQEPSGINLFSLDTLKFLNELLKT